MTIDGIRSVGFIFLARILVKSRNSCVRFEPCSPFQFPTTSTIAPEVSSTFSKTRSPSETKWSLSRIWTQYVRSISYVDTPYGGVLTETTRQNIPCTNLLFSGHLKILADPPYNRIAVKIFFVLPNRIWLENTPTASLQRGYFFSESPDMTLTIWCCSFGECGVPPYSYSSRAITFTFGQIPLGKVWTPLFSLQLWVNSRTD